MAQWHGHLQQTPRMNMSSGLLLRIQSFRERERVFWNSVYLENSSCCYFLSTLPLKAANQVSFEKRYHICFTDRQIVLHNTVESTTHKNICCFGWINQLPFGVGRLSYFLLAEGFPRSRIFVFSEDHALRGLPTQ